MSSFCSACKYQSHIFSACRDFATNLYKNISNIMKLMRDSKSLCVIIFENSQELMKICQIRFWRYIIYVHMNAKAMVFLWNFMCQHSRVLNWDLPFYELSLYESLQWQLRNMSLHADLSMSLNYLCPVLNVLRCDFACFFDVIWYKSMVDYWYYYK